MVTTEALLNVLAYLFEHYIKQNDKSINAKLIASNMLKAGFHPEQIHRAVNWLEHLNERHSQVNTIDSPNENSFRVFCNEERNKIDIEARRYLLFLQQANIVDNNSREIILSQAMSLKDNVVTLPMLKTIILMTLVSNPTLKNKLVIMEELIVSEDVVKH